MPADYVNKLARMFQDIKVSEDLNQHFKEMHKHNKLALPGKIFITCELQQTEKPFLNMKCVALMASLVWKSDGFLSFRHCQLLS